jgi:hypothetical protein
MVERGLGGPEVAEDVDLERPPPLLADGLPVYPAGGPTAQIDVDVFVTLVAANLGLVCLEYLQAHVGLRPASADCDPWHRVELTLAGMLRCGIAGRGDQPWLAPLRGSCVVVTIVLLLAPAYSLRLPDQAVLIPRAGRGCP